MVRLYEVDSGDTPTIPGFYYVLPRGADPEDVKQETIAAVFAGPGGGSIIYVIGQANPVGFQACAWLFGPIPARAELEEIVKMRGASPVIQ